MRRNSVGCLRSRLRNSRPRQPVHAVRSGPGFTAILIEPVTDNGHPRRNPSCRNLRVSPHSASCERGCRCFCLAGALPCGDCVSGRSPRRHRKRLAVLSHPLGTPCRRTRLDSPWDRLNTHGTRDDAQIKTRHRSPKPSLVRLHASLSRTPFTPRRTPEQSEKTSKQNRGPARKPGVAQRRQEKALS